jgi:hypothetical protein
VFTGTQLTRFTATKVHTLTRAELRVVFVQQVRKATRTRELSLLALLVSTCTFVPVMPVNGVPAARMQRAGGSIDAR